MLPDLITLTSPKTDLDIQTLTQGDWVVPRQGAPTRTIFDHLFLDAGLSPPENIVESNSHILIRSLLWGSDRMALISEHQVQHELESGLLSIVPFAVKHAYRPIGITTRKDWQPTDRQKLFLDILRKKGNPLEPDSV
ncbi:LysR substrate-binding domain-containing protein [Vibrio sp. PP-XX7]